MKKANEQFEPSSKDVIVHVRAIYPSNKDLLSSFAWEEPHLSIHETISLSSFIILQIIFLFTPYHPSFLSLFLSCLFVHVCVLCPLKFGISGAQALSAFYKAHCTMGQSPFLMKILYYFIIKIIILYTHTHICSLIIFKFREKCELSDTLIKNILGGVACVFLVYFVVIIPPTTRDFIQNFTVFFIFLDHGWSLANTLSGPESCSCPISWIFSIICMIFVSKLLNHIHTIESSPTPNRKTD